MKAISIWQPWASCLAHGFKTIETRTFRPYERLIGETLGVCSTKTVKPEQRVAWEKVPPAIKLEALQAGVIAPSALHQGALLGFVRLISCTAIDDAFIATLSPRELALGWYGEGRFAWQFADFTPLPNPVAIRGSQGIWEIPGAELKCAQDQIEARAREARSA